MALAMMDFVDRLVPISDLSKGKAGKIFADVEKNNNEYIIMKNNQPTAVLVSLKDYRETQEKVEKLEKLLETIEDIRLLQLAESRDQSNTMAFEDFVAKQGYSMEEIGKLAESVEIE